MTTSSGLAAGRQADRGLTSHDVVARVRRILGETRVGHAGTLDPMATGLLVIGGRVPRRDCCASPRPASSATSARCASGVATDSLDADGAWWPRERRCPTLDHRPPARRPRRRFPARSPRCRRWCRRSRSAASASTHLARARRRGRARRARGHDPRLRASRPTTRPRRWSFDVDVLGRAPTCACC